MPRWLADPLGPLSISPAYLPHPHALAVEVLARGRPANYQAGVRAQAAMMQLAEREWMALMERTDTRPLLRDDGCLELYESEAEWRASLAGWEERQRFGIGFRHVRGPPPRNWPSSQRGPFPGPVSLLVPSCRAGRRVANPQRLGQGHLAPCRVRRSAIA